MLHKFDSNDRVTNYNLKGDPFFLIETNLTWLDSVRKKMKNKQTRAKKKNLNLSPVDCDDPGDRRLSLS